jgi:hypothetical protein
VPLEWERGVTSYIHTTVYTCNGTYRCTAVMGGGDHLLYTCTGIYTDVLLEWERGVTSYIHVEVYTDMPL